MFITWLKFTSADPLADRDLGGCAPWVLGLPYTPAGTMAVDHFRLADGKITELELIFDATEWAKSVASKNT